MGMWDDYDLSNDIALIELPSPIEFNDYIMPSCLPSAGDTADEEELVTCTGWGKDSDSAGGPLNMKAEVKAAGQQWKQVGVVSFGSSLGCEVGYPAGFTRTESYLDWISQNTGIKY